MSKIPITDGHIHMGPEGLGVEAAKIFQAKGGTHIVLVCKPYANPKLTPTSEQTILESYDITLRMAEKVRAETTLEVFVVLGAHPSELSKLVKDHSLQEAEDIMLRCLGAAAKHIEEGHAVALGEVGRPHYPVEEEVWEASNRILGHAMALGKDCGAPLVLHTEGGTDVFRDLAEMADKVGLKRELLIKHFSRDWLEPEVNLGLFPSVVARTKTIQSALGKGTGFVMETDFIDVPSKPNVVLPPDQVPKLTRKLLDKGEMTEEQAWTIHKHNIEKVYKVDVEL